MMNTIAPNTLAHYKESIRGERGRRGMRSKKGKPKRNFDDVRRKCSDRPLSVRGVGWEGQVKK